MKSFSPGLSDSLASVIADPAHCPHCDSSSHIAGGLCVGCLLQAGLDSDGECEPEALASAFAEVSLPDKNWRLGNYEILEEIGRGGMGVIYRARQRHSRRIVAVKRVLSYHSDSRETLARFRREAQAAASLDHPNILPIYEVSESEDGLPFFSMKFAPGGNLQEVGPALRNDPRQCVALVAKVARAVQYAHAKGILHRDLKPGNILLDGRGEPLVSDFGLAKWLDTTSDLTRTLTIFGTPGYIAPEQASGSAAQLKPSADVYSLGAILFDLLAGRPPFLGTHALSVIRQAAESPAPKLRTLSKIADRDLETICARCLEREPQLRYPSAHDLAEDLERWLEGRPIIARPVSPPIRIWRWSRRNPLTASAMAGCFLLLGALAVWQFQSVVLSDQIKVEQVARRSIAVIPFLDLDNARADAQLAETVAVALQEQLGRFAPSRTVAISRGLEGGAVPQGNVSDIREVGRRANVRTVLAGTTRVIGGQRRFVLRLADAGTGDLLLTRSFDVSPDTATETMVNGLAKPINAVLDLKDWSKLIQGSQDPGLVNTVTRDLIVSGRELAMRMNVPDMDRAIGCYEKAIALEPGSWIAHSYLASAAGGRIHLVSDLRFLERAEAEARAALKLAPDAPDTHRSFAGVLYQKGQFAEAFQEQLRALELGPPDERLAGVLGMILEALGQPDKAIAWFETARRWEMRPGTWDPLLGDCWACLGEDDRAEAAYRRADDLQPEVPRGWVGICRLRLLRRDFAGAREIYRAHTQSYIEETYATQIRAMVEFFARNNPEAERLYGQLYESDRQGGGEFYGKITYASALGHLKAMRGDPEGPKLLRECIARDEAALHTAPKNAHLLYRLAAVESALGRVEPAVNHLQAAAKEGWLDYRSAALDPRFDSLRSSDEYNKIISEVEQKVKQMRSRLETVLVSQRKDR